MIGKGRKAKATRGQKKLKVGVGVVGVQGLVRQKGDANESTEAMLVQSETRMGGRRDWAGG